MTGHRYIQDHRLFEQAGSILSGLLTTVGFGWFADIYIYGLTARPLRNTDSIRRSISA